MGSFPRIILTAFLIFLVFNINAQSKFFSGAIRATSISERWELDSSTKRGIFLITPYRPVYITAGRWSDRPNDQPKSENPNYSAIIPVPYNNYETKFQLSFKTKLIQGMFGNIADIWLAYTQKSHWQIYNQELSRPFRETNYEPEVILNFATNFELFGFKAKMAGVSFNHQSNGRGFPLSRSWNRIVGHIAFEKKHWSIFLKPWYRLHDEDDENPLITSYVGRGEAIIIYNRGPHQFALSATHPFTRINRGRVQIEWTFPVISYLRVNLQIAEGYGETMIDYNHRQTNIGVSAALIQW